MWGLRDVVPVPVTYPHMVRLRDAVPEPHTYTQLRGLCHVGGTERPCQWHSTTTVMAQRIQDSNLHLNPDVGAQRIHASVLYLHSEVGIREAMPVPPTYSQIWGLRESMPLLCSWTQRGHASTIYPPPTPPAYGGPERLCQSHIPTCRCGDSEGLQQCHIPTPDMGFRPWQSHLHTQKRGLRESMSVPLAYKIWGLRGAVPELQTYTQM